MEATAKKTIWRIELWHVLLLLTLAVTLGRTQYLDLIALLVGGVFMGVNFLLLAFGVAWLLTPLASKGKVKAGISLLLLKILIFLGLLLVLFFRFQLDAISFAVGFSTLLVAILLETLGKAVSLGT
jgi:hypothetical protein